MRPNHRYICFITVCVTYFSFPLDSLALPPLPPSLPVAFYSKMDPFFGPYLLTAILPLGTELMHTLSPSLNPSHSVIFKDFFDCLVSLAGTNKNDGHLQLARAVVEWIPRCIQVTPMNLSHDDGTGTNGKEEGESTGKESEKSESDSKTSFEKCFAPLSSLFLYISHLSTAVQFSSDMANYTVKRGVAGEDDPLLDEDDEEVGFVGSGGGADEEESTVDDSVSG